MNRHAWKACNPKGFVGSNPTLSARKFQKSIIINFFKYMYTQRLTLSVLPERLGVCHFDKNTPIPNWALAGEGFSSIAKTNSELSVICAEGRIPGGVLAERGWRAFKVEGPLGFESTGIVSSLSIPLAEAQISILYISTFESDYILVEERNLGKAKNILATFCEIRE